MKLSQIPQNPKILLYGYGVEGQSSEAWLRRQFLGAEIEVYEDEKGLMVNGEWLMESVDFLKYDLIVKSPGVPPSKIPAEHWSKVTSNFRLFLENLNEDQRQKVIGITGSKGKSTTAKFCHELLQSAGLGSTIIGNFGVPALEGWDQLEDLDYLVAECSSFQLYDLAVSPHYAIFLSFFADHLDWHNNSQDEYFEAKKNLWKFQRAGDYLLVPKEVNGEWLMVNSEGKLIETKPVPAELFPASSTLQAQHFRQNLGPVWALAEILKIPDLESVWQQTAKDFEMIEHRLEKFLERDGWTFYNDSIATSPDATIKAVEYLGPSLSGLILDGQDLGVGACEPLAQTLEQYAGESRVALVKSDIAESFSGIKTKLKTKIFTDYSSALAWLLAGEPGVILFSPGGKSFNRFKNYAERGRVFKALVQKLR